MPLPDNFSPWEHLQDTWRKVHNHRVREHFSDLDPDDLTINTPRGALKVACIADDADTADMTLLRAFLFWMVLGEAAALQMPVYGIPIPSYQEARKFKPQIEMYFQEDPQDIEEGYAPLTGRISFRIINESSESLVQTEALTIARKVKSLFATGTGFVWQKGREQVTYTDTQRGYALRILCKSKQEGKRVIEQVLDIQGHTPEWKLMNHSVNEAPASRYPVIPPRERIYGESRRLPRQRPVGDVRFRYALLHIWGLSEPIVLVDRHNYYRQPALADS